MANHLLHQIVTSQFIYIGGVYKHSILQNSYPVTNNKQLFQPVRNIYDSDAFVLQILNYSHQSVKLFLRQSRRRFIHDNNLGIRGHGFCQLSYLLMTNTDGPHFLANINSDAKTVYNLLRLLPHAPPINKTVFSGIIPKKDVFRHT